MVTDGNWKPRTPPQPTNKQLKSGRGGRPLQRAAVAAVCVAVDDQEAGVVLDALKLATSSLVSQVSDVSPPNNLPVLSLSLSLSASLVPSVRVHLSLSIVTGN